MFVLFKSALWFAWPRKVLMTGMIDSLMSLAVNSLLFFSFTKSFVTWVMAVVPLAQLFEFFESVNLLPYLWMLNVLPEFLCCIFLQDYNYNFLAWHKFSFYLSFFHKIRDFVKLFKNICHSLLHWLT